ncbi:unnamed protein product [Acanthoscelides obtectus]|uniref:Uncharacterized protein n=1 Tax=Acanthoscelides obtectus TaxID=200917 RepID=A0A9P0MCB5_ACAOB|nr:unnamed protein product [Acanthoscelides obtectus]CAK1677302.1 hypothetical protein AOBTE_LOCUS31237 [Acanthoscelides obtectus]
MRQRGKGVNELRTKESMLISKWVPLSKTRYFNVQFNRLYCNKYRILYT